jgi:hypothetical protein
VGPRTSLDNVEKRKFLTHPSPSLQPVAIPTVLSQLPIGTWDIQNIQLDSYALNHKVQ